jgi:hypothetical protein
MQLAELATLLKVPAENLGTKIEKLLSAQKELE